MKKLITLIILTILIKDICCAQYYYKEILGNQQANSEILTYKKTNTHHIKIRNYEALGQEVAGFYCEKKISNNFKKTTVFSKTIQSGRSILNSYFNDQYQLIQTYDTTESFACLNLIEYDKAGRVSAIKTISRSKDDDFLTEMFEDHIYTYANSLLSKMMVIKNQKDTSLVLFYTDEAGNVTIEKDTRNAAKYYYYYNTTNKLTDVVQTNEFKKNFATDYAFEYDDENNISQMITSKEDNNNRLIWKYDYENGFRIQERIFSGNNKFVGKIIYEYK